MIYRIYPPIGIARVGNSATEFFIGAETPGSPGTELQADGSERPVTEYKTGDTGDPATKFQVKRQAARFRLYEFDTPAAPGRPARLPDGAAVTWAVRLVNKKDAVQRPPVPPATPPDPVVVVAGREDRIIDSGVKHISMANATPQTLSGTYLGQAVTLGELRLDPAGNLLVLAGAGISRTFEHAPIGGDFYNNPGWHDDVGDGPVAATITLADGTLVEAEPSWIVTAPPDFAPAVEGVVTLYDAILQAAVGEQLVALPAQPSFTHHIAPLIQRARGLRWVHNDVTWPAIPANLAALSNTSNEPAVARRRENAVRGVLHVERAFFHPDYTFRMREWQKDYLAKYKAGNFIADFGTAAPADPAAPETFTRVALDRAVGEGFFPGIETGRLLEKLSIYLRPFAFRIDHAQITAGEVTALMALPWQADFKKCDVGWWPTQRPNHVPASSPPRPEWDRNIQTHQDLVDRVMQLGVITRRPDQGGQEVQEESRRHPEVS